MTRSCTNSATWLLISIPWTRQWLHWSEGNYEPSIRSSGKWGLKATSRPPKPHPMSAMVTCFEIGAGRASSSDAVCAGVESVAWSCVVAYAGYRICQSIISGLDGLVYVSIDCSLVEPSLLGEAVVREWIGMRALPVEPLLRQFRAVLTVLGLTVLFPPLTLTVPYNAHLGG